MLNFILKKDREAIFSEYLLRLFTFFFFFFFFVLIILFSLFMPSVFYTEYKKENIIKQFDYVKKQVGPNNLDPIETIKNINLLSKSLIDNKINNLSNIVDNIILLKNNGIKINSISITDQDVGVFKIIVLGISKTRENLTNFDKELKKSGFFQSVDLPVSNLIKSTEADFSINLIYKK
jgi:hypothetical protein